MWEAGSIVSHEFCDIHLPNFFKISINFLQTPFALVVIPFFSASDLIVSISVSILGAYSTLLLLP